MPDADVTETETQTTTQPEATPTEPDETPEVTEDQDGDGDSFPRKVVVDLRRESAGYRDRAKVAEQRADELARQLHTALVAATGKLTDPADLDFDAAHLDNADALTAAVDALTDAKPHLKARRVAGDIGQATVEPAKSRQPCWALLKRA